MTREGEVVDAVMKYLRHVVGAEVLRNNTGAISHTRKDGSRGFIRFGEKGSADIIACIPGGHFLAVECKAGKNGLTVEQREYLERVRQKGGLALCVRSVDELIEALSAEGY